MVLSYCGRKYATRHRNISCGNSLLTLFWSSAASALDRCSVEPALWHFHWEMDAVGSVRQHADIYIRRKTQCWGSQGKGKRWENIGLTAVITKLNLVHGAADEGEVRAWASLLLGFVEGLSYKTILEQCVLVYHQQK